MNTIILDIDNCISNDGWRIRYIDWDLKHDARWQRYHERAGYDFPKNRHLVREKHPTEFVLFLTGRPESQREYTERWLEKNYLPKGREYKLMMRRERDVGIGSVELKRRMLLVGVLITDVVAAYDDRADIIEMYKEYGINATVLAIHNKDPYAPPNAVRQGSRVGVQMLQ
jgi:hypothetical protein